MEQEAMDFLKRMEQANAEDLKRRVLEKAKAIIKQCGLDPSRLKEVGIDISDYLDERN